MAWFYIVLKLLVLKMLLACTAGYEFGYHPSAEEFDSLLRETSRTWTRDLLANERRRAWTETRRDKSGHFVPKYSYERERRRYLPNKNSWPGLVQKLDKFEANHYDGQQGVLNQIDSTFNFTMFSDDTVESSADVNVDYGPPTSASDIHMVYEPPTSASEVFSSVQKPASNPKPSKSPVDSNLKETHKDHRWHKPLDTSHTKDHGWQKPLDTSHTNTSDAHFPIFFTNPATGIVYAITEIGQFPENSTKANDSIPIYITKAQYDRDMALVKRRYDQACTPHNKDTKPSYSSADVAQQPAKQSTARPQIIRLEKPSKLKPPSHSAKRPTGLNKLPPPVMVQTTLSISDQVGVPSRPYNQKKLKKKKKKKRRRPGRRPTSFIAKRQPLTATTTQATLPYIVMGTRLSTLAPSMSTQKLPTQLEKPHLPTTIFGKTPFVASQVYMMPVANGFDSPPKYANHRMRRSVANATTASQEKSEPRAQKPQKTQNPQKQLPHNANSESLRPTNTLPRTRKRLPKLGNETNLHLNHMKSRKGNRTQAAIHRKTQKNVNKANKANKPTKELVLPLTENTTTTSLVTPKTPPSHEAEKKRKKTKRPKKKRKGDDDDAGNGNGFDWFGLFSDSDDGGDDDYDYYYEEPVTKNTSSDDSENIATEETLESIEVVEAIEIPADSTDASISEDLNEDHSNVNSSTAEEEADFGALEDEYAVTDYQTEAFSGEVPFSTSKQTVSKIRIRRRPASGSSSEDYRSEEEDDDEYSGVGGFFRMIFYPVEVAMTRLFDGFSDKPDDDRPKYPTYTFYNNAPQDSAEEDTEQANSFSSWLGSWFGFNRRTKNIGSTTATPAQPPPLPAPTEEPGWFESWFGYGSKATEASYEDYDEDYKWFSSWFGSKPKARRRTTTVSPVQALHAPILTIADPLKNPQNWIGILAHHIVNSTATTTHNPLIEAFTRATITTTENPDIPRVISYDKYQIWRLKPQDEAQVKTLEEYKKSEDGARLRWLKGPSLRGLNDVLVPPKMLIDFQGTLNYETIAHEVLIFNVGKAIAYEKTKEQIYLTTQRPKKNSDKAPLSMSWNKYYEYDDIVKYLESIRMRFPHLVELLHIGRSYEGRPLIVVKVESKEATPAVADATHKKLKHKKRSNPGNAIFIEAGTHGMEWIGPATATWMISELLKIMKSNKTNTENDFIKKTAWYILPVLNPDGYVYTHEYDRFWKKTRSRHISRPSDLLTSAMSWLKQRKQPEKVCYGVDLDRNWHNQWGRRGASTAPCNENYAGPTAFSEPETKALSEFLMDYRKQIKLFISMQSYGQVISYPVKANASFISERMDDFLDVAMVGTDGLRKKGSKSRYKIDSANDLTENRSGCSDGFAAYEIGIPFSYTMQLADNGVHGYLLPSSSIEPAARDAFEIITAMLDYI